MKIFLTGGTGFIGSNLIKCLGDFGFKIVAQRRRNSSVPVSNSEYVTWVVKDLDEDFSIELLECDALVHLATHSAAPPYAPLNECLYWNVSAMSQLFLQAADSGIENFIVAGSCFEYGLSANSYDYIPPSAPLLPNLSYSTSKAAATLSACGLARERSLKMDILRIFQAYGEGESASRFWPSLRSAALNGDDFRMSAGEQVRDFIHVSDICKEILQTLHSTQAIHGRPLIRNIGTGRGTTLLDFARYWWSKWDASGKLIPGSIGLRPRELLRIVADTHSIYEA